ncbi:MAG: branched-chain amino acid ABC transporter ATP-binding protein/permease [Xanthobacteraceae bacterium]|jgi:branched-chain amino acid transport system ATP-binding protein
MSTRTAIAAALAIAATCFLIAKGNGYHIYIIAVVGLTAIVGIGLNVLLGLSGQISLGHVAFYAIGAYTLGILTTRAGWSFWPALPIAGLVAGCAGILLAIPALRVRGPYLAMVTIAFSFVVEQGTAEWAGLTGGWNGLMGIALPQAFGFEFSEREVAYFVLALTILALLFYARLSESPWGHAMRAVRDSETASLSIGLDPTMLRTTAFAVSAIAAGIAGGVFAALNNFISPESFLFFQSILFLLVVMLGGADTVLGPLIGAVVVVLVPELLSFLAGYRLLFVGLLMLLVLRLAPTGIVGLLAPFFAKTAISPRGELERDVIAFLSSTGAESGLSVRQLSVSFGGVRAVRGVSFDAPAGRITSVIGPNGAGKTTALNLICGFYRPDAGSIRLADAELKKMPAQRIARLGIARTYQTSQLFATMAVLDNVLIGLRQGRLGAGTFLSRERDPERLALAQSLLAFVGYRGSPDAPAGALAHVDKRLVEIARALATRPRVLALDEPAAGLDAADTQAMGKLLQQIARAGIAVILIEHDMQLVMGISDHLVVLDAGSKIAEGPPAKVATDPAVLKAYMGEETPTARMRARPIPADAATLLAANDVSAAYGAAPVLRSVALEVRQGEAVAVLGANGAGKTTLMRTLSGLMRTTGGEIRFLDERIDQMGTSRIVARGLILVPEGRQVFPELSVIDNLRLGAFARPAKDERIDEMLERFPALRARAHQRAGFLSGGEQQMLALARGLMAQPRVLMLDEPSLGLAPKLTQSLYDLLAELRDEGTTILLVDQMAVLALSVADRGYVLQSGKITHAGDASAMRADAALTRAYLGEHATAVQ